MKILITGGAGYIGTSIIHELLNNGHHVVVYDNFMYNADIIIPYLSFPNFSCIKGDILDTEKLNKSLRDVDVVIHLAAIVGYGACEKNPSLSIETNITATKNIISMLSKHQSIFFSSTYSNYGDVGNLGEICDENTPLNPQSVYAKTKVDAEKIIMTHPNAISYRFATAFGVSPRMKVDLFINELTYLASSQKYFAVYQPENIRSFIHVKDISKSFLFGINNLEKMKGQIYNVGSNDMNWSKRDVAELIRKKTNCFVCYNDFDTDKDCRNYTVSYDKISSIGFKPTTTMEEGIDELLKIYEILNFKDKRYVNTGI